jgi:glycosyltransferase involved in cell wall biosynthesis
MMWRGQHNSPDVLAIPFGDEPAVAALGALESRGDVSPLNPAISLVVPVYNGGDTIGNLVDEIHAVFASKSFEVILVNDGSTDGCEQVCSGLAQQYPETVTVLHLSRNFGEHNAVLAGLGHAAGEYVAVLDDDGQNPPMEVLHMMQFAKAQDLDVVYGRYQQRKHSWFRILGSWLNDKLANLLLKKPSRIYLSSFKVMRRFVVQELIKFKGPFPYIDGLVLRTTRRVGQIDVSHRARQAGRSGYTLGRLVGLMLNMMMGFSIIPMRLVLSVSLLAILSLGLFATTLTQRGWTSGTPDSISFVLVWMAVLAAVQILVLGTVGEYLGRIFLHNNGMPQYVVRSATFRLGRRANDRVAAGPIPDMMAVGRRAAHRGRVGRAE